MEFDFFFDIVKFRKRKANVNVSVKSLFPEYRLLHSTYCTAKYDFPDLQLDNLIIGPYSLERVEITPKVLIISYLFTNYYDQIIMC